MFKLIGCLAVQINRLILTTNVKSNYSLQFANSLWAAHSLCFPQLGQSHPSLPVSWFSSFQRARTALNNWIRSNSSEQKGTTHFFMGISPTIGTRLASASRLAILNTNYLCSITVLTGDLFILTINWQWSGGTVAVDHSCSVVWVLASGWKGLIVVLSLIRRRNLE